MKIEVSGVIAPSLEKALFKVIRKHGIFLDMMKVRNKHFENCGIHLIRGQFEGKNYESVKKELPEEDAYTMRLKLFDNFITEYLQTMRLHGVFFAGAQQVDIIILDFVSWLLDNDIGFDVEVGEKFYETMRKRFLTDK